MTKIAGSGSESGSGSISQRHGSAYPDPDPHQNVMDPQHRHKLNNEHVDKADQAKKVQILPDPDPQYWTLLYCAGLPGHASGCLQLALLLLMLGVESAVLRHPAPPTIKSFFLLLVL
jgi:hypothetical protein